MKWRLKLKELRATEQPADVIQDRLFEMQWTARQLAYAMDYSEKHLSLVMNGKARVTGEFAVRYWRACGGNPRRLLRAQADADLRKAIEDA